MRLLDRMFGDRKPRQARAAGQVTPARTLPKGATALRSDEAGDLAASVVPLLDFKVAERVADTYLINQVLGAGGFGTAYLAHHESWNLDVVLKVPQAKILADEQNRHRITTEAEAWTDLGLHAHIAYCYYVHPMVEVPILVIEYLDGGNLREWISEGRCADLEVGLDLAIQVCHGLEHAHAKGLVHRDIKPENILLTKDGTLKITDFGAVLAARRATQSLPAPAREFSPFGQASKLTLGWGIGTPGYMPPEQLAGTQEVTERSDIFALGVCMYEMLCGRRPYGDWVAPGDEPEDPRALRGDDVLPTQLCDLMRRCVHWDGDRRPEGAKLIRTELCAIYAELFEKPSVWAELPEVSVEADGWNNRGVSYLELGNAEEALNCFRKALASNPQHLQATYNQSLLQWRHTEIDDYEVLRRLERLGAEGVDAQELTRIRAEVHRERFDPAAASSDLDGCPEGDRVHFSHRQPSSIHLRKCVELSYQSDSVGPLVFLVDRSWAALGHRSGTVTIWDVGSGRRLQVLTGHSGRISALSASRNGGMVLSAGKDETIRFWNAQTGRCQLTMKSEEPCGHIFALAISPDGQSGLSGGEGTIHVWDFRSGELIRTVKVESACAGLLAHRTAIRSVAFSPDGNRALSGSENGIVRLWDLRTYALLLVLEGHTGPVLSLHFDGEGRSVLSASVDKSLKIWDLKTGTCVRTLTAHHDSVQGIAVSEDARWAVSAGADNSVRIWDLRTQRCLRTLDHKGPVDAIALSRDGRLISGTGSLILSANGEDTVKTVHLWEVDTSRPVRAPLKVSRPLDLTALRLQKKALVEHIDQAKVLLDLEETHLAYKVIMASWRSVGFRAHEHIEPLYARLCKNGRLGRSLSVSGHSCGTHKTGCQVMLSADAEIAISCSDEFLSRYLGVTEPAIVSTDGRCAITRSGDIYSEHILMVWDLQSKKPLSCLRRHHGKICSIALSADGDRMLVANSDGIIQVWDLSTAQCVQSIRAFSKPPHEIKVMFSGGKNRALSLGQWYDFRLEPVVHLFDLEAGECLHTMTAKGWISDFTCDRDGHLAFWGGAFNEGPVGNPCGGIKLWDLATGHCIKTIMEPVTALAASADGSRALSGHGDRTLRLWDMGTGECLRIIHVASKAVSIAITPDARWAISGHEDGQLVKWRLIWSLEFPPGESSGGRTTCA